MSIFNAFDARTPTRQAIEGGAIAEYVGPVLSSVYEATQKGETAVSIPFDFWDSLPDGPLSFGQRPKIWADLRHRGFRLKHSPNAGPSAAIPEPYKTRIAW